MSKKMSLSHQLASDNIARSIPRLQGSLKFYFKKGIGNWIENLGENICKSHIWLVSRTHEEFSNPNSIKSILGQ